MPRTPTAVDLGEILASLAGEAPDPTAVEILDAASEEILRHGATDFALDAVVEASGVARSTIYRRFGDRNGLLTEAVAHQARRFFDELAAAVDGVDSLADRVVDAFARGLAFAEATGLAALIRRDPVLVRLLTLDGEAIVSASRDQLVALAASRGVPVADPVAATVAEVLVRLAISYVVTPPAVPPDPVALATVVRSLLGPAQSDQRSRWTISEAGGRSATLKSVPSV